MKLVQSLHFQQNTYMKSRFLELDDELFRKTSRGTGAKGGEEGRG